MRNYLGIFAALSFLVSGEGFFSAAAADGIAVARPRKVRAVTVHVPDCQYGACVHRRQVVCPDRFSCYSLYGAYGPYGGPAYWARYSSAGWHGGLVVRRR